MNYQLLLFAVAATVLRAQDLPPSCIRPVYCDSELLHHVQLARLYSDSKTFVDLQMRSDETTILSEFDNLLNETDDQPSKEQLKEFVDKHFDEASELEEWTPKDYTADPKFLIGIRDPVLKQFAKDINSIWPSLGRRIKPIVMEKPELFSLIPLPNGFIIPGGRFKEVYYWDTYWIIEGLLICGMHDTAKGMIENLISLLQKFGHIPNGGRWYYQERSQPPLLSAMMALYIKETNDLPFLKANLKILEEEMDYWITTQIVTFDKGDRTYTLLRYYAPSAGPRPESYYEDYISALQFESEERKTDFYIDMKSAAESGWDFSTRWFITSNGSNAGNLTTIHTRDIIPVDLNAIFTNALQNLAYFNILLHNIRKALHWGYIAKQWRSSIEDVLWNEEDGIWYDYNIANNAHRKYFYPTNLAPLWMGVVDKSNVMKHAAQVVNYMQNSKSLDFPGGVPASLIRSGEQWDFPNAWPPLVSIIVSGLDSLNFVPAKKLALQVAQTWVRTCLKGYQKNKQMFEKYDVEVPGQVGGGGEYVVQDGFGWSNGVVLEFLSKYGRELTATDPKLVGVLRTGKLSNMKKIIPEPVDSAEVRVIGLKSDKNSH